jgi:hypothetical protein
VELSQKIRPGIYIRSGLGSSRHTKNPKLQYYRQWLGLLCADLCFLQAISFTTYLLKWLCSNVIGISYLTAWLIKPLLLSYSPAHANDMLIPLTLPQPMCAVEITVLVLGCLSTLSYLPVITARTCSIIITTCKMHQETPEASTRATSRYLMLPAAT